MLTATDRTTRLPLSFVGMWAAALIGAGTLRNVDEADFERFLGGVSPVVAVAIAGAAGAGALVVLDGAGWVGSDPTRRGLARSTLIGLILGSAIVVMDSWLGFGQGINIAWPTSVVFYPVMAFIAEVAFHLVPLALVVTATRRWAGLGRRWAGPIIGVALFEAIYQVVGSAGDDVSSWLLAYLTLHLTAFAVGGLTGLRRYGFWPMMWLRLLYYAIWHVAWGALRLGFLF